MSTALPSPSGRLRCAGCGNLTRFDVTRTRRTTEFWHFDLAGDHVVEETELRAEVLERVVCRWCGRDDAIEVLDRYDRAAQDTETLTPGTLRSGRLAEG